MQMPLLSLEFASCEISTEVAESGSRNNGAGSGRQKLLNLLDDSMLLFGCQTGIHGQRHYLLRQLLGDRESSFFVPQAPVGML